MEAVKKKKAQAWEQGYNFHLHVALPVFFVSTAAFILMLCHYQSNLELVSYFDALILCNLAT